MEKLRAKQKFLFSAGLMKLLKKKYNFSNFLLIKRKMNT